jgi:hypothetical protein
MATAYHWHSLHQTRQTRNPFIPSTITTFVTVGIFNLFVTTATVSRAALWSMQGTKNEWPTRNFDQSI